MAITKQVTHLATTGKNRVKQAAQQTPVAAAPVSTNINNG
jgi:hypothetical protein